MRHSDALSKIFSFLASVLRAFWNRQKRRGIDSRREKGDRRRRSDSISFSWTRRKNRQFDAISRKGPFRRHESLSLSLFSFILNVAMRNQTQYNDLKSKIENSPSARTARKRTKKERIVFGLLECLESVCASPIGRLYLPPVLRLRSTLWLSVSRTVATKNHSSQLMSV